MPSSCQYRMKYLFSQLKLLLPTCNVLCVSSYQVSVSVSSEISATETTVSSIAVSEKVGDVSYDPSACFTPYII